MNWMPGPEIPCGYWRIPAPNPTCRISKTGPSPWPLARKAAGWIMKSPGSGNRALNHFPWGRASSRLKQQWPPCWPSLTCSGLWLMAHSFWLMACGSWLVAHGFWLMAYLWLGQKSGLKLVHQHVQFPQPEKIQDNSINRHTAGNINK